MRLSVVFFLSLFSYTFATPAPQAPTSTSTASAAVSTACGDIVNSGEFLFFASDVFDCLTSVPFNAAVATRFIKYYNDTMRFQSTLAYLKAPPASYRQPPVDFIAGLNHLQQQVDSGQFANQYAFEASVQTLVYSAHDSHVNLLAGLLATFTFASPYGVVSLSQDGVQLPKMYIKDDVYGVEVLNQSYQYSAISTVNGENATNYFVQYAATNAIGFNEPHGDWNSLLSSPALDIQYENAVFEGYTTFYPGDTFNLTFENGTEIELPWLAVYNGPSADGTGPLETGGDFYNYFVLGFYPNVDTSTSSTASATPTPTSSATDIPASSIPTSSVATPTTWVNAAYPTNPVVAQPDLGNTGSVTCYFLPGGLSVISIPSFYAYSEGLDTFSSTVQQCLTASKNAGMQKVLIDLQQNGGGDTILAYDIFRRFFPSIVPFGGSRLRAHPYADVLGNTDTTFFDAPPPNASYYDYFSADEWVATSRINADTGRNFTSWAEFFGPHPENGDYFTTTASRLLFQQYNLSSTIFDSVVLGVTPYGYGDNAINTTQLYSSQDIAVLTDGQCASACSLFMEMMVHEANVTTVVVGGQPIDGPMQAVSGTRGAEFYTSDQVDNEMAEAIAINATTAAYLPDRSEDVWITYMTLNLRDQIRKGESVPVQFAYEAADCRIFYTPQNVFNYTRLWTDAANAIFHNPSLCVLGSTGYGPKILKGTNSTAPPINLTQISAPVAYGNSGANNISQANALPPVSFSGKDLDANRQSLNVAQIIGTVCTGNPMICTGGTTCQKLPASTGCGTNSVCLQSCNSYQKNCGNNCFYLPPYNQPLKVKNPKTGVTSTVPVNYGFCPNGCSAQGLQTGNNQAPFPPNTDMAVKGRADYVASGGMGDLVAAGMLEWE